MITAPQEVYSEYVADRSGEDPFTMHGKKWQFVTCKNSSGKLDIGVYAFGEDRVYNYIFWREMFNLN
jgi:hypothetical protein